MEHKQTQRCAVIDAREMNLGYDITSFDPASSELRPIEIKGIGAGAGRILLSPSEWLVAQRRCDCF